MSSLSPVPFFPRLQNFLRGKGRLVLLGAAVALHARPQRKQRPVVFFNASTRINDLSLNAGFSLVTSWAIRTAGVPVVHFVCNAGMSRCVLGANPDHPEVDPPCKICVRQSRFQTIGAQAHFFPYHRDEILAAALKTLSVEQLAAFEYRVSENWKTNIEYLPLGTLVLPSLRWRMRVNRLQDDEATRSLYREFILSAWNVAHEFSRLLEEMDPQAVVLFNGQFFPEAVARFLARGKGIRAITHEVGLQPFSAYFTEGEATAYPIAIPEEFYRYILMCRCRIVRPYLTQDDRLAYWIAWLAQKREAREIGRQVSRGLRAICDERIDKVASENEDLRAAHHQYEDVRALLRAMGIPEEGAGLWYERRIAEALARAQQVVDDGVLKALGRAHEVLAELLEVLRPPMAPCGDHKVCQSCINREDCAHVQEHDAVEEPA